MDLIHIALVRFPATLLHDLDRLAHDHVQWPAVGHHADVVVEDAAGVEERDGEPEQLLDDELGFVHERVPVRLHLVVEVVFAEREDGDEVGAGADGELDEAFAALEHEAEAVGLGVEALAGTADDDRDGAAHAFVVGAAVREDVFAALARDGGEAEGEGVVAIEGDAEVGVEGEEGVGDAREELGEAEGFGAEGGEGAVRDYAVGVVAEDVFAGGGKRGGAV